MSQKKALPYFSVIIPCLNEEKYLPLLLKDLSRQTDRDFEVFVVDGQSDDKTPDIVASFKTNYPLGLISTSTRNVSHQRNLGAKKSSGQVLVFFDADTQIPKNYLEKIHHTFDTKRPHFLNTYMKVDSAKATDQWFPTGNNILTEIGRIIKYPLAFGAAMMIKRSAFEDIGGFDEKTKFGEDSQLFQTALEYNYKYLILASPKYTFSLRRLRAEGAFDTMHQYTKLVLSVLIDGRHDIKVDYPMGGHVHNIKSGDQIITRRMEKFISQLNKNSKTQSKKITLLLNRLLPQSTKTKD
jgi:glycosyltransferase involved in cell wall biosynthesis